MGKCHASEMEFETIPEYAAWIVSLSFDPSEIVACPGLLGTVADVKKVPAEVTISTVPAQVEGVALIVIVSVLPDPVEEIDNFVRPVPLQSQEMITLLPRKPGLFA